MITKLKCWLWGHKTVHKSATGETFDTVDRLTGMMIKGHYYKFTKTPYCTRCGKTIHNEEKGD